MSFVLLLVFRSILSPMHSMYFEKIAKPKNIFLVAHWKNGKIA
jgi:hypothetical protein